MNQECINDLMWKSMADWQKNVVIDGGNLSAAKRRIKELEAEIKQLQNTSSNSDKVPCIMCCDCKRKCKTEGDLIECNDYLPNYTRRVK